MMRWAGKLAGVAIGLWAGPIGAAVGLLLGHQLDRGFARTDSAARLATGATGRRFFSAAFGIMGHIAKADGRVSEAKIEAARYIMQRMRLTPDQVKSAIESYTFGKQADFPFERALSEVREALNSRQAWRRAFMEIQMEAALADGWLTPRTRDLIWRIALALGLSRVEVAQIEAQVRLDRGYSRQPTGVPARYSTADAYGVLGLQPESSDAEVKLAYRRLMNRHHPDKVRARGVPDCSIQEAEDRTREIRAAWDVVRAARNMR